MCVTGCEKETLSANTDLYLQNLRYVHGCKKKLVLLYAKNQVLPQIFLKASIIQLRGCITTKTTS
ncbi:hypothetical protein MAR_010751 [Mya arenaria]|uniref:Uncharacterized protein n=1 Tax=Mya arenaria TaxID=6604 RepID=A0ABY7FVG2_MYAAR|nr:hypothetical protein MAR_010751 [Mya arenaria]